MINFIHHEVSIGLQQHVLGSAFIVIYTAPIPYYSQEKEIHIVSVTSYVCWRSFKVKIENKWKV